MVFELAVGNFDRSQFGSVGFWLVYVFFLVASLMVLVVMMNLLISIVSEAYNEISRTSEITWY